MTVFKHSPKEEEEKEKEEESKPRVWAESNCDDQPANIERLTLPAPLYTFGIIFGFKSCALINVVFEQNNYCGKKKKKKNWNQLNLWTRKKNRDPAKRFPMQGCGGVVGVDVLMLDCTKLHLVTAHSHHLESGK